MGDDLLTEGPTRIPLARDTVETLRPALTIESGSGRALHVHDLDPSTSIQPERLWEETLDCARCARAVLLMVLDAPGWVGRRVERVRFRDDRTATRRTGMDFTVPCHAPAYRHGDGRTSRLVPLTVMRRKTLVDFSVEDATGTPLSLLGMRHAQLLTRRMIEVLAAVTPGVDETDPGIRRLAHDVAVGTQVELDDAVVGGHRGRRGAAVTALFSDPAANKIIERLANTFVLLVTVPEEGPHRRIVRYQYDEPLTLSYKRSGYDGHRQDYPREAEELRPWAPRRLRAALGWDPTLIRFPIPAAELARSYHFEIEAPRGVRIDSAALTAGRPNEDGEPDPDGPLDPDGQPVGTRPTHSWDEVAGGLPLVGLHACDVPTGSRSRAQVHLRLDRRGWLAASLLSSVLSMALLWAIVALGSKPDAATVSTALLTVVAAVVVLVLARSEHEMASRLVTSVRKAAVGSVFLLIAVGALVGLGRSEWWLYVPGAVAGTLCTLIVGIAWKRAGASRKRISPWEQGLGVHRLPQPLTAGLGTLAAARSTLGFDQPAVMVESSEGDNRQTFTWTRDIEARLVANLCHWSHEPDRDPPEGDDAPPHRLGTADVALPVPRLGSARPRPPRAPDVH